MHPLAQRERAVRAARGPLVFCVLAGDNACVALAESWQAMVVFEHVHCTARALDAARNRLARCPGFGQPVHHDSMNEFYASRAFQSEMSFEWRPTPQGV